MKPVGRHVRVAVVQMDTQSDVAANLVQATELIRRATRRRAQFVALPESCLYLGPDRRVVFTHDAPPIRALRDLAATLRIWLLLGSVQEAAGTPHRRYNTSWLIDPEGRIAARYRKMHLFRCRMPDGHWLRETGFHAGTQPMTVKTPFGRIGLTICYDVRMPELFGILARRGAEILCLPSNFMHFTGQSHWHVLVRARAIENQAYMIAPAQCGHKYNARSYGHALIVGPWGETLAEAGSAQPEVLVADLDLTFVDRYRQQLPALRDRMRTFAKNVTRD
ncbi:MAG: carbon-nitrogen hydrolase family protein [Deltaproteobacteria bacterium]|nr:carbon-nitrogen hydrolase family protein [Deltaproteobacteria bacterium]